MNNFLSSLTRLANPFLAHPVWTFLGTLASLVAIWLTIATGAPPQSEERTTMTFANDGLRYFERIQITIVDGFVVGSFIQGEYDSGNQTTFRFRSTSPFDEDGFLIRFEGDEMPYTPPFSPLNLPQSPPYHWRVDTIGNAPELVIPAHVRNNVTMEWENGEIRYAIQR